MHRTIARVLTIAAVLFSAAPASAQFLQWQGRGFVDIGIAVQSSSRDFHTETQSEVYDELASMAADQSVGSGAVFDLAAGYRVWRNLTVGIGYSRFGDSSNSSVTASIPHPLEFDSPRTATTEVSDLDHSESAIHFVATWMIPVTDTIDVGVFGGPSIFSLRQDIVSNIVFSEGPAPFRSITLSTPEIAEVDESAVGINVGAQVTYLLRPSFAVKGLRPRFAVNGFLRYTGASIDVPSIQGGSLDVGGVHLGVGLRIRF